MTNSTTRYLSQCPCPPHVLILVLQLYRVFPISHNYVLSKLLFSPDSSQPGTRILVANEVRNSEEYQRAIAPLQGRVYSGSLLKFSVFDETPHKVPTSYRTNSSQLPRHMSDPWSPSFSTSTRAPSSGWDTAGSRASVIPPPPIIFSTPPVAVSSGVPWSSPPGFVPQQSSIEVDNQVYNAAHGSPRHSPRPLVRDVPTGFWTGSPLASPQPLTGAQHQPQHPRTISRSSSCCSVSQGKAEIQTLLTAFKLDLDRIMGDAFGPSSGTSESHVPSNSAPLVAPSALPVHPSSASWVTGSGNRPNIVPTPSVTETPRPCVNMWCMICGRLFGGPWYSCDRCSWHVLVSNHTAFRLQSF